MRIYSPMVHWLPLRQLADDNSGDATSSHRRNFYQMWLCHLFSSESGPRISSNADRIQKLQVYRLSQTCGKLSVVCGSYGTGWHTWCLFSSHASTLYKFIVVYLDDIYVLFTSLDEHVKHLRILFGALRRKKLFCYQSKCHFDQSEVKFLVHEISAKEHTVDTRKTEAVAKLPTPTIAEATLKFLVLGCIPSSFHLWVRNSCITTWFSRQEGTCLGMIGCQEQCV